MATKATVLIAAAAVLAACGTLRAAAPAGPVRFAVLLSPRWPDGAGAEPPPLRPLAEWKSR